MSIYCLVIKGGSLTEEIGNLLFESAQAAMRSHSCRRRIKLNSLNLTGEITTRYKPGFMGTVAGIVFSASFDWDKGSIKTDFIVRPLKDIGQAMSARWVREPLFPAVSMPSAGFAGPDAYSSDTDTGEFAGKFSDEDLENFFIKIFKEFNKTPANQRRSNPLWN